MKVNCVVTWQYRKNSCRKQSTLFRLLNGFVFFNCLAWRRPKAREPTFLHALQLALEGGGWSWQLEKQHIALKTCSLTTWAKQSSLYRADHYVLWISDRRHREVASIVIWKQHTSHRRLNTVIQLPHERGTELQNQYSRRPDLVLRSLTAWTQRSGKSPTLSPTLPVQYPSISSLPRSEDTATRANRNLDDKGWWGKKH